MTGTFGLLSTGFVPKRFSDILSQMQPSLEGNIGAGFQLQSETPEGQLMLRGAEQAADLWEGIEQVFTSFFPDTASGTGLDLALSNTGAERIPGTASVVNGVILTGTPGTIIPSSLQISVQGNSSAVFKIAAATTIGGGGTITASFVATQQGPVAAPPSQLTVIVTPVSGLASATNPTGPVNPGDSGMGTLTETDGAFRVRCALASNQPGTGTPTGLLQSIQAVANVSGVEILYNDTDSTSSNGLPPHSFQIIVSGGTDAAVANAIWANKPAGITTFGTTSVVVYDSNNTPHTISFTRIAIVQVYAAITVTTNSDPTVGPVFPPNGDALIQAAVAGLVFAAGQTVYALAPLAAAADVPGVLTVVANIGLAPAPVTATPLPMTSGQQANILAANVTVTP